MSGDLARAPFNRARSHEYLSAIEASFVEHFRDAGYAEIPGVPVTHAKQVDASTRFIGSHTSVVKPLMFSDTVTAPGHFIVQTCVRTQNLALMSRGEPIHQGSVFQCNGLIAPYSSLGSALVDLERYFAHLGISAQLVWHARDDDSDLLRALWDAQIHPLAHRMPGDALRHTYGDQRLAGRDVQVDMFCGDQCRRLPIAVVSAIDVDNAPRFCEVTITPGKIMQQLFHCDHFLDCFPIVDVPHDDVDTARKLEDCIALSVLLLRHGLRPAGTGNVRRLLRKYLAFAAEFAQALNVGATQLCSIVSKYEQAQFGGLSASLAWADVLKQHDYCPGHNEHTASTLRDA
jgi:hypothetical protein